MKSKTKNENQDYLIRIVYSKWWSKKAKRAAIFKIEDQNVLARMAVDRNLKTLLRIFALSRVEDDHLKSKISEVNDYRIRATIAASELKMGDQCIG